MRRQPESPVEHGQRPFALPLHFGLRVCGATTRALLFKINVGILFIRAVFVKAMLLRNTVVQAMVLRTRVGNDALIVSGSDCVCDIVVVSRTRAVVHVLMLVFLGDVKGQVVTGCDALLGRRVVLVLVGHVENGTRAIPVDDVEMSEELLAEFSDRSATTGIIFSHSGLRYHESGGHQSTAGPDYNLDSPSAAILATSSFDLAGALWSDRSLAPGHLRHVQGL